MFTLTLLLAVTYLLSVLACHYSTGHRIYMHRNPYVIAVALLLVPLVGLRTDYNDTAAYILGFQNAPSLLQLFKNPENLTFLKNPLFEIYTSFFHSITTNYHIYFMVSAIFVVGSMIHFLWTVSDADTFPLNVFTYITLGTYIFSLAAMKQTIAMAILTYAVIALIDRKYIRFFILVLIAGLFHTYAFLALALILITGKPWRLITYLLIGGTLAIMLTFKNTISTFLAYADAIGKSPSSEEVFSGAGMNLFRVAVYSIVPLLSFLFRPILEPEMKRKHYLLLHMSIVSFMFMLLASIDGANMFGRMARYFELGTICMFPWIIRHLFNSRSQSLALGIYLTFFSLFLAYGLLDFDATYSAISIGDFVYSIIKS